MIVQELPIVYGSAALRKRLEKGFQFLANTDFQTLSEGRFEIDGNEVFANVQKYKTHTPSSSRFESHRKYFDIQYVVEGRERILVTRGEKMVTAVEYDEVKDMELWEDVEECSSVLLEKGQYALLDLEDYHKPRCRCDDDIPVDVFKIVVKILAE